MTLLAFQIAVLAMLALVLLAATVGVFRLIRTGPTDACMDASRLIAWAQIGFSFMLFAGTLSVIVLLETGFADRLTDSEQKMLQQSVRWLEDGTLLAIMFWFQRLRSGGVPDTPTIVQEQTAPDGTRTVLRSPAHLPPPPFPTQPGSPPGDK